MPERLEDVSITIDGRRWHAWTSIEIKTSLDSFSTIAFDAPFEPDRAEFRSTFQPFSYKPLVVSIGGEVVFDGVLVDVTPSRDPDEGAVQLTAYAKPAVLEDATPPASAVPLELNGLSLRQIAERLLEPFGLEVEIDDEGGAVFRRVALEPTDKIHGFLVQLAQQRGLLIANTAEGRLRFVRAATPDQAPPRAHLREGQPPLIDVTARFSPQSYFSEITAIAQTRAGRLGAQYTVPNPHLTGVVRPHTFQLSDTDDSDAPTAARAKLGRMLGNMAAYTIELPTWRDPHGELWTPNTTLTLEAPGAMIYRATQLLIRSVMLKQDDESITSELELALPGAFSGDPPTELPWA